MFGLGWPEAVVITVVAIALFGAKRLPEIGRGMGETIKGFRDELGGKSTDADSNSSDSSNSEESNS
jgi:sec-independent protein translocase protein TatA